MPCASLISPAEASVAIPTSLAKSCSSCEVSPTVPPVALSIASNLNTCDSNSANSLIAELVAKPIPAIAAPNATPATPIRPKPVAIKDNRPDIPLRGPVKVAVALAAFLNELASFALPFDKLSVCFLLFFLALLFSSVFLVLFFVSVEFFLVALVPSSTDRAALPDSFASFFNSSLAFLS